MVENHWVIQHASYRATVFAPLHIGRTTWTTEAAYSGFSFPATPADARLR